MADFRQRKVPRGASPIGVAALQGSRACRKVPVVKWEPALSRMAGLIDKRCKRLLLSLLAAFSLTGEAAAEPVVIGVSAPLSGASALLGRQIDAGARAAAAVAGAEQVRIETVDDGCTAEGGSTGAMRLIGLKAQIVIGYLCTDALAAAMPAFKDAGIPVITVGVRANSVTDQREKTGWPVARLCARADSEREAAGSILADLWRDKLFAIVDDGTIYGRELAESVRGATEAEQLKPVFTDTFRPGSENQVGLVGRLARAGATHVFAGGDREDIAIMTRDAARLPTALAFAGGEALRADAGVIALAAGTLMIGLPEWADEADPAALAAIRGENALPEGYALPAFAAVQIAAQVLSEPEAGRRPATEIFLGRTFGTAIGPVSFDGKGDLAQNLFRLFRYDGARFVAEGRP